MPDQSLMGRGLILIFVLKGHKSQDGLLYYILYYNIIIISHNSLLSKIAQLCLQDMRSLK